MFLFGRQIMERVAGCLAAGISGLLPVIAGAANAF
jgi:hypothetical protein